VATQRSTSEIESVADKLKSSEHKRNGVTMPVLKTMVVDLLAGKNRVTVPSPRPVRLRFGLLEFI
jgi:hypothetical protein